ncbi:Uncharacterized protein Fot_32857 [Forsythia ovata]|uniref:Uncharacterized protein n=1 Tax=Forsythia ovata TaxID=205694 RepID=A0ABD1T9E5_9LAMI
MGRHLPGFASFHPALPSPENQRQPPTHHHHFISPLPVHRRIWICSNLRPPKRSQPPPPMTCATKKPKKNPLPNTNKLALQPKEWWVRRRDMMSGRFGVIREGPASMDFGWD